MGIQFKLTTSSRNPIFSVLSKTVDDLVIYLKRKKPLFEQIQLIFHNVQLLSVPPCLENGLLTYVLCNVTHRLLLSLTWPWDLCLGQGKKFPFFLFFHRGNFWQFFSKNFIFESILISYPQIFSDYFIDDSDIVKSIPVTRSLFVMI